MQRRKKEIKLMSTDEHNSQVGLKQTTSVNGSEGVHKAFPEKEGQTRI